MNLYHYVPGQTPLDEEEKVGLIPSIVTREDLDAFEQENMVYGLRQLQKKNGGKDVRLWK